jgi:hypothetical protein
MSKTKKTVRISENDLVNLIDNIVTEAVQIKKKEWIAEQAAKGDKTAILEQKLSKLEEKISKLSK